ncbi:PH domain-containing protein [Macrococcoides canis]|uniref:PH domain-containing protein n=1 Tax=Macrococcoides canis TaxID=1855823 RepID=UPI001F3A8CC9|nr:PH domain-containing protein [Macrococcus canis]UJS27523.1 PH domain-containing protein [Macrococcus canis]UTG99849.1 PH domain-containing protein [Macrococcus canis]WBF53161.1 PH domain-containing protein [Macrococcus canis]
MNNKHTLHYSTYLSNALKAIKENLFLIGIGLFWIIRDGFSLDAIQNNMFAVFMLIITLINVVLRIIEARITQYWIEDDKLMLETGLISKKIKEIYIGKIQTIDTNAGVANQILGGVIMQVRTAGDGIELNSISKSEAERLSNFLTERKRQLRSDVAAGDEAVISESAAADSRLNADDRFEVIYRLAFKDLLFMSATSSGMFTVIAIVLGLYSQIDEIIPLDGFLNPVKVLIGEGYVYVIGLSIILLIMSYIIGIFVTAMKYHRYTVRYDGEVINVNYGLFERIDKYIVGKNIQSVKETQSYFRKLFNKTKFTVVTTSEMKDEEEIGNDEIELLPFISRDKGYEIVHRLLPYNFNAVNHVIPKRSIRRYFQVSWLFIIIITSVVQYYWFDYAWIIGLLFLVLTFITAIIKYKNSGYAIIDDELSVSNGGLLSMTTTYIKERNIISLSVKSTPFMNKANLRNIEVDVAAGMLGSTTSLDFIELDDAAQIYDWFMMKERSEYEADA